MGEMGEMGEMGRWSARFVTLSEAKGPMFGPPSATSAALRPLSDIAFSLQPSAFSS